MGLSICTLFAGMGESQPRQVESWFREELRTNPTVPVVEFPQSALPWDVPELLPALPLAGVVAVTFCSCCFFCCILQPRGGESLVFSILPLSLLGRKVKAKKSTLGLDHTESEPGRALPRAEAMLTPAPQVRSPVSSKGLCSCSYFVLRGAITSASAACSHRSWGRTGSLGHGAPPSWKTPCRALPEGGCQLPWPRIALSHSCLCHVSGSLGPCRLLGGSVPNISYVVALIWCPQG